MTYENPQQRTDRVWGLLAGSMNPFSRISSRSAEFCCTQSFDGSTPPDTVSHYLANGDSPLFMNVIVVNDAGGIIVNLVEYASYTSLAGTVYNVYDKNRVTKSTAPFEIRSSITGAAGPQIIFYSGYNSTAVTNELYTKLFLLAPNTAYNIRVENSNVQTQPVYVEMHFIVNDNIF